MTTWRRADIGVQPTAAGAMLAGSAKAQHWADNLVMDKEPQLIAAVDEARRQLGDSIVIVDHWNGDRLAVGIARRDDHQQLAYIAVNPTESADLFFVALETAPAQGSDLPYATAGEHNNLTIADVVRVIGKHLRLR